MSTRPLTASQQLPYYIIYKNDTIDLFEKGKYQHCIRSIKKTLRSLKFDIVKRKGKPIEEYIRLYLWFKDDGSIEVW
jgi:hypothetical protein